MKIYTAIIIIIGLTIQETATTMQILRYCYQNDINVYALTVIFLILTILCFFLGFGIGSKLKNKDYFIMRYFKKNIERSKIFIGINGEKIFLLLIATTLLPPLLTGILSNYLSLTKKQSFFFVLIGNTIWYLTLWMIVIGVCSYENKNSVSLLILISFILFLIIKFFIHKKIYK